MSFFDVSCSLQLDVSNAVLEDRFWIICLRSSSLSGWRLSTVKELYKRLWQVTLPGRKFQFTKWVMSVRSRGIDVDRELANDGPLCVGSCRIGNQKAATRSVLPATSGKRFAAVVVSSSRQR